MVNLDRLRDELQAQEAKLSYDIRKADETNKLKEKLVNAESAANTAYNRSIDNYNLIAELLTSCNKGAVDYRDERVDALESRCKDTLDLVFPEEDFYLKINYLDHLVRSDECQILIGTYDNNGKFNGATPMCCNGGFAQELISSSLVATTLLMLGADTFFIDEGFHSGDAESVAELGPFFQGLLNAGMQITLIEHKPEMYSQFSRHEILLHKDRRAGRVIEAEITDHIVADQSV